MGCGRGNYDLNQQLARLQHRALGRSAEILDRDFSLSARSSDSRARLEGDQRGSGIRSGGAIAQVAADRGAILDLQRSNQVGRLGQSWVIALHVRAFSDVDAGNGGAQLQAGLAVLELAQFL